MLYSEKGATIRTRGGSHGPSGGLRMYERVAKEAPVEKYRRSLLQSRKTAWSVSSGPQTIPM